jgi:hypothetical protein
VRRVLALAGVAIATLSTPAIALAHQGNPNMESIVRGVTPRTPGLTLTILNRDDRFQLLYQGSEPIVLYGYNDDEYARFLPGGVVQVNHNSPAFYLNDDRAGTATVPAGVKADSPPDWHTVTKSGRFEWHDHRMHWMGTGTPPQVKDTSLRTKVYDYKIPIKIGATTGAISGTLWWTPRDDPGLPVGGIVAFVVVVVAGLGTVVLVRRRRRGSGGDGEAGSGSGPTGADEAPTPRPTVEAW